jgi:hypothetical protein
MWALNFMKIMESPATWTCKGKRGKAVPLRSIEVHLGDRRNSSYSFLTSALEGGEWSASRPGSALPPGIKPPYHKQFEMKWPKHVPHCVAQTSDIWHCYWFCFRRVLRNINKIGPLHGNSYAEVMLPHLTTAAMRRTKLEVAQTTDHNYSAINWLRTV